jgi:hypothetical protein
MLGQRAQRSEMGTAGRGRRKAPQEAGGTHVEPARVIAVKPLPVGWKSGGHLLASFLAAFGMAEAQANLPERTARRLKHVGHGSPSDPDAYGRLHVAEAGAARATLAILVKRIDQLRGPPLRRPSAYEEAWRAIVEEWNAAVRAERWATLPTLCEACGRPVLLRAAGKGAPSAACGDPCRHIVRARAAKLRAKLQGR